MVKIVPLINITTSPSPNLTKDLFSIYLKKDELSSNLILFSQPELLNNI